MKKKQSQKSDLRKLLNLVERWERTKSAPRKVLLGKKLSAANEHFYKRWHQDGLVLLLQECAAKGKG